MGALMIHKMEGHFSFVLAIIAENDLQQSRHSQSMLKQSFVNANMRAALLQLPVLT